MSRQSVKQDAAYGTFQQKRRQAALERQRNARQEKVEHSRSALHAVAEEAKQEEVTTSAFGIVSAPRAAFDADMALESPSCSSAVTTQADTSLAAGLASSGPRAPDGLHGHKLRQYYSRQLMQPEWMSDIPPDLAEEWLVTARPEGRRCLLIAAGGVTVCRQRSGALTCRGTSPLPGGSPTTNDSSDDFCVVDVVFHEPDGICYCLDLLVWRSYSLYEAGAECRLFWLDSKMREEGLLGQPWEALPAGAAAAAAAAGHGQGGGEGACQGGAMQHEEAEAARGDLPMVESNGQQQQQQQHQEQQQQPGSVTFRFELLPCHPATPEGLAAAYQGPHPYTPDGLYFRHREGHYMVGGSPCPLALLWKDQHCSTYWLDTDAAGVVPEHQQLVLVYQADGSVGTGDEPPVVLARLPEVFVTSMGAALRPGRLLRFSLLPGGFTFSPAGTPCGADLGYEGPANQRRGRADMLHKLLFQYHARRGGLTFQQLQQAAAGLPADETMC